MQLEEAKKLIESAEPQLADSPLVSIHTFVRDEKPLTLALTERFRRRCKKGRVWKSKVMLTAVKNAQYGFDPQHARSAGGYDGIFLLTRDHKPANEMMRKMFDKFIDKPGSEAGAIAEALGVPLPKLTPARLVSHHMRLLGLLLVGADEDTLVLVDYDDSK